MPQTRLDDDQAHALDAPQRVKRQFKKRGQRVDGELLVVLGAHLHAPAEFQVHDD